MKRIDNAILAVTICVIGLFGAAKATAQEASGKLSVRFMTASLDSLVRYSAQSNANQTTLDGFRIQIYSGSGVTSKNDAAETQARFMKMHPEEKAYIIYNAPFWRVRVGDYRTRSEALRLLNKLGGSFSGSYIVRDNTVRKQTFRE
ncbi:MAG: SPOR domain-containing protein [Marinilabiliaceae bacterium]